MADQQPPAADNLHKDEVTGEMVSKTEREFFFYFSLLLTRAAIPLMPRSQEETEAAREGGQEEGEGGGSACAPQEGEEGRCRGTQPQPVLRDPLQQDQRPSLVQATQPVPAQIPRQLQAARLYQGLFAPYEGRVPPGQGDSHRCAYHHAAIIVECSTLLRVQG